MHSTERLNAYRMLMWVAFLPALIYLIVTDPSLLWVTLVVYCSQQLIAFNAYMHRFVAHRSYETYRPIEMAMGLWSTMCLMGSPVSWAWLHRVHHRYSDTPKDPHSPEHMGVWKSLFCLHYVSTEGKRVAMKDIYNDSFMVFLHKHYFHIHAVVVCALLVIWGFDVLLAAYVLPAALHAILIVYSLGVVSHQVGYQNFETGDHSKNSLLAHILTVGDGWHNNHHKYPGRYSLQVKWWELDPTAWFIWLIKKRG